MYDIFLSFYIHRVFTRTMAEERVLDLLLPHLGVIIGSKKPYLNSSLPRYYSSVFETH